MPDGRVERAKALRQKKRTQILEAAQQVFAEKGYHNASIQNIIDTAEIARGTFYLHFASKREAFAQLLDDFLSQMQNAVVRVDITSQVPPYNQLLANIERVLDIVAANRELFRLSLHQSVDFDPEFEEKVREFYQNILTLIQASLASGIELGLVRPGNLQLQAAFAMGSIKEILLQTVLQNQFTELSQHELAHEMLMFALNGVLLLKPSDTLKMLGQPLKEIQE